MAASPHFGPEMIVRLSVSGTHLCPGEPFSQSLDHAYYESEPTAVPPVPFNTESECGEEACHVSPLDFKFLSAGTFAPDESAWGSLSQQPPSNRAPPLPTDNHAFSEPLRTSILGAHPDSSADTCCQDGKHGPKGGLLENLIRPSQCCSAMSDEEPVSSPPSLLDLYLNRRSRRGSAAAVTSTFLPGHGAVSPNSEVPPLAGMILDQKYVEDTSSIADGLTSRKSISLAELDMRDVDAVESDYGRSCQQNGNFIGSEARQQGHLCRSTTEARMGLFGVGSSHNGQRLGSGLFLAFSSVQEKEFKPDDLIQIRSARQDSPSLIGVEMDVDYNHCALEQTDDSDFPNHSPVPHFVRARGRITRARVYGDAKAERTCEQMLETVDGWRCPKAQSKRQKRSRQGLLDNWLA